MTNILLEAVNQNLTQKKFIKILFQDKRKKVKVSGFFVIYHYKLREQLLNTNIDNNRLWLFLETKKPNLKKKNYGLLKF